MVKYLVSYYLLVPYIRNTAIFIVGSKYKNISHPHAFFESYDK